MTAGAMTVGMVPMALALERGSQMQAPLGLAVIGGLVMSTFATLLVLPSIFAIVIGRKVARSPSIYPGDRRARTTIPWSMQAISQAGHEAAPPEIPTGPPFGPGNVNGGNGHAPDGDPSPAVVVPPEAPPLSGEAMMRVHGFRKRLTQVIIRVSSEGWPIDQVHCPLVSQEIH